MLSVTSHVLDHGNRCARRGLDMTGIEITKVDNDRMKRGDRIGVISGLKFTPVSAYLITRPEFDSNQFCVP